MFKNSDEIPACAGCGTCCRLVVELAESDVVPESFVVRRDGLDFMDQRGDGSCLALDPVTKLCTIYEQRPNVCRVFERGSGLCRAALLRFQPVITSGRGTLIGS